jgi:hypothetical protein
LFNSGSESKQHECGCGFCVRGEFLKYVQDFKIISGRICYLRLKAKWFFCTLIKMHMNEKEKNIRGKGRILYVTAKYKSNS